MNEKQLLKVSNMLSEYLNLVVVLTRVPLKLAALHQLATKQMLSPFHVIFNKVDIL